LVSFLFFTGARPSEAIALRWRNVKPEYILFTESRVHGDKGCETKDGLKTQRQRRFPVNQQLAAILAEMQRLDADDLVFPSPKGISIRWGNFTTRAWNKVLEGLPDITHRNPYQTRHSFISHCKEAGIPSTTIAEWVGNSATMIDQVYAKPTGGYSVPEL
jgi:integrase